MNQKVMQKTVSVRMPPHLYSEAALLAKSQGLSFNQLVQHSLEVALSKARQDQLREGFEQLAQDAEDMDFAFAAQSEVVNG